MSEARALRAIRLAIGGRNDVVLWRNSTGVAEYVDRHERSHRVPYGLCPGAADLIGIIKPCGRFLAIEVKGPRGRLSKEQERFLALIKRSGGVAGVARTEAEAHALVDKARHATTLAGDELDVLAYVKARLSAGRLAYGQLRLADDSRKWDNELAAELADALVYIACKNSLDDAKGD